MEKILVDGVFGQSLRTFPKFDCIGSVQSKLTRIPFPQPADTKQKHGENTQTNAWSLTSHIGVWGIKKFVSFVDD